jgi:hypothetical protein
MDVVVEDLVTVRSVQGNIQKFLDFLEIVGIAWEADDRRIQIEMDGAVFEDDALIRDSEYLFDLPVDDSLIIDFQNRNEASVLEKEGFFGKMFADQLINISFTRS